MCIVRNYIMVRYDYGMFKKPLQWIVVIVLIIVVSIAIYIRKGEAPSQRYEGIGQRPNPRKVAEIPLALQDVDADGLKDWEEALWGTDSNNPDTDGDGTKDGEEVKLDRNPLKAGPDDVLSVSAILQNQYAPAPRIASRSPSSSFGNLRSLASTSALSQMGPTTS